MLFCTIGELEEALCSGQFREGSHLEQNSQALIKRVHLTSKIDMLCNTVKHESREFRKKKIKIILRCLLLRLVLAKIHGQIWMIDEQWGSEI